MFKKKEKRNKKKQKETKRKTKRNKKKQKMRKILCDTLRHGQINSEKTQRSC
jgi:hypothetical protein